jgi:hypothetical protein
MPSCPGSSAQPIGAIANQLPNQVLMAVRRSAANVVRLESTDLAREAIAGRGLLRFRDQSEMESAMVRVLQTATNLLEQLAG